MNIIHIGLASHFTEGMTYQDNQLTTQNCLDGNNVMYVSDSYKYQNGKLTDVGKQTLSLNNGMELIRLPYKNIINKEISKKIRRVDGLYQIIQKFNPDIIFSHSLSYYSIKDVRRYVKEHKNVKFYADTHTSYFNSGRNWVSLHVLHRTIYRLWIQNTLPYLNKLFYVGEEEKEFSIDIYKVPREIMEFLPLGGFIPSKEEYTENRKAKRDELGIYDNNIVFIHSGKLTREKRTIELIESFIHCKNPVFKLLIIGSIEKDIKDKTEELINLDNRIAFIGWKSGKELREYLCASDVYLQPGSVSATMQNAICCGCMIVSYPHKTYKLLDKGNFVWVENKKEITDAFENISNKTIDLDEMKRNSFLCANAFLDYKELAKKIYNK